MTAGRYDDLLAEAKRWLTIGPRVAKRDAEELIPALAAALRESEECVSALVSWLGASDWSGPQLPIDLARRIAAGGKPEGSEG